MTSPTLKQVILKAKLIRIQFFLFVIIVSACTDVIQISEDSIPDEILVVEGEITDQSGPYTVKLSTTASLDGLGSNTLGRNAEVIIEEDGGKEEVLRETSPGIYQTNIGEIQGVIGKSYRTKITLANGNEYHSEFESMPEPVEITLLSAQFVDEKFTSNGISRRTIGHNLSVQLVKESNVQKFFQFKVMGIQESEISVEPALCPLPTPLTPICYGIKNPLQNEVKIFSDTNISKDSYSLDIVIIPVEQKRRYLASVEVHSFSSEAYVFLSAVKDQLEAKGDIFDSPIPPIIGNVKNIATGVFAQGHFTVASVSSDNICIDRSNVVVTSTVPLACEGNNCIQVWAPASYRMPNFGFCQ